MLVLIQFHKHITQYVMHRRGSLGMKQPKVDSGTRKDIYAIRPRMDER